MHLKRPQIGTHTDGPQPKSACQIGARTEREGGPWSRLFGGPRSSESAHPLSPADTQHCNSLLPPSATRSATVGATDRVATAITDAATTPLPPPPPRY